MGLGHNVSIFGVGSKIKLVMDYLAQYQADCPKLVVNGFSPIFTVDKCFNGIFDSMSEFLKYDFGKHKNVLDKIRLLAKKLGDDG